MDFELDETQQAIAELAGKILEEQVSEASLRELEQDECFRHPRAWQELARAGLLGVAIAEKHGGMGGSLIDLCTLLQQVGRCVAPVPVLANLGYGALAVQRFGTDEQKKRLLPGVADGSLLLTGALEEDHNDEPLKPVCDAIAEGAGYLISGQKLNVPLADEASRIVVACSDEDGRPVLLLLDPGARGVELTRNMSTHGEPVFRIDLRSVQVSSEDVLAGPDQGEEALSWVRDAATVCVCAVQLGLSEKALSITAGYTAERHQFGVPIATFQAVKQRAADCYIDVESIRVSASQAAWLLSEGRPASQATRVAKFHAAMGGYRVAFAAQHLHGGMGYDVDYPIHRYYLWSKAMELSLGTASVQLSQLGAALAERPFRIAE